MSEFFERIIATIVGVFNYENFYQLGCKLAILALAFLAPMQNMLLSMLFLIVTDFLSGIWASIKEKKKISSSKLSRTVSKTLVYFTTVVVVHVAHIHLLGSSEILPIESIAIGFIAITELKSIFENLNRISKNDLFSVLIERLSNEGRKRPGDEK